MMNGIETIFAASGAFNWPEGLNGSEEIFWDYYDNNNDYGLQFSTSEKHEHWTELDILKHG
jgi:hypothetical protein